MNKELISILINTSFLEKRLRQRIILKLLVELSRLRSVKNACFFDINIVFNEIIIFLNLKSGRKGMGHWTASYIGTQSFIVLAIFETYFVGSKLPESKLSSNIFNLKKGLFIINVDVCILIFYPLSYPLRSLLPSEVL